MVKSCCACGNVFEKGNGIHFYNSRRTMTSEQSGLVQFVVKDGALHSPLGFVANILSLEKKVPIHCLWTYSKCLKSDSSAQKRKLEESYSRYERRKATKRKRGENMVESSNHSTCDKSK